MPDRNLAQKHPEPVTEHQDPVFATWQAIQARIVRDLSGMRTRPDARDWSEILDESEDRRGNSSPG